MKTKRLVVSTEMAKQIKDVKNFLEYVSWLQTTTDETAEWLFNICELLDEVC